MNWTKGFLLLTAAACVSAADLYGQPNLIFVMADDLGAADLSCYGQKAFGTPNLDLMAAEGMCFAQAYSGSCVGAPSRATLLTGMDMANPSVRPDPAGRVSLAQETVTVAQVLKQAGYVTGGFGRWELGDRGTEGAPEKQGFDRFYGYYRSGQSFTYYPDRLIDTGKEVPLPGNKDFHKDNTGQIGRPDLNGGQPAQFAHDLIKRAMFDWIRANKDRHFFCYAPWTPPHAPFEMPASDPAWQAVKDREWSDAAKGHAAFTLMVDRDMGELFALLRELDIDHDTVVFFSSDNGSDQRYTNELDSCGPFRGTKGTLYEGGLRVPLIVRWPGVIQPAQVTSLQVCFPDVMPTLVQLANLEAGLPFAVDGLSFVPTLLNRRPLQLVHDHLYWEYTPVNPDERDKPEPDKIMQAVRIGNLKGIRNGLEAKIELYNLVADRGEKVDLAKKNPDAVREIAELFNGFHPGLRPAEGESLP